MNLLSVVFILFCIFALWLFTGIAYLKYDLYLQNKSSDAKVARLMAECRRDKDCKILKDSEGGSYPLWKEGR